MHKIMTLRDWFAGQALVGLMQRRDRTLPQLAEKAYDIADAMKEARKIGPRLKDPTEQHFPEEWI